MLGVPSNRMILGSFIDDWIHKAGVSMLSKPLKVFGKCLNYIYEVLEKDPTSAKDGYGKMWNRVVDLNDTFMVIGTALLTIFFIYGFCRDSIDVRSEVRMESTIKMFIRYVIGVNLITCFIKYVPELCRWAVLLTGVTHKKMHFNAKEIAEQIVNETNGVIGFFLGLVMFFVCIACAAIIFYSCLGRFLNFYLLIPFSSIALSTIVGGGQLSQTGWTYIKNMLALIFEIVAMGMVLALTGPFLGASIFHGISGGLKGFFVVLETIVKMITVTAVFKGAGGTIRKAMNL